MCENDGKMWVEGAFTQFHIIKPQSLYKDLERPMLRKINGSI